jgi:hypothetical protein
MPLSMSKTKDVCRYCNEEIRFYGGEWNHTYSTPRHPAIPVGIAIIDTANQEPEEEAPAPRPAPSRPEIPPIPAPREKDALQEAERLGKRDADKGHGVRAPRQYGGAELHAYKVGYFGQRLLHPREEFRDAARRVLKTELGYSDNMIHDLERARRAGH